MKQALWTSGEAAAAVTGGWTASGVSIDTRTLQKGDLFIALKDARDGHEFVAEAFRKGAAAAVVSRRPDNVDPGAPLIIVNDTQEALEGLGAAARARSEAMVIGVTGSVGKTGAKEMLRAGLEPTGPTHAAEKSYNNHWGVPLTLARMPRDTAFAAIEIGMNHPGEIGPLSRLARPHVAIITTIAPVHMAAFRSVEEIADAKAEIFEGLAHGGVAILNRDNPYFERLSAAAERLGARVVGFGAVKGAEAELQSVRISVGSTVVKGMLKGKPISFRLGAPGKHLAMNAMAVLAAIDAVGGDVDAAMKAFASWSAPDGRGRRWTVSLGNSHLDGALELIDESYNANPTSTQAALAVLGAAEPADGVGAIYEGRRIAFLGDMLELGPDEVAMHAGLAQVKEMDRIDTIHTCGPRMRALHEALPGEKRGRWFEDSEAMAAALSETLDAGDVAMVKGSLGARMGRVAEAIRRMGQARPTEGDSDAL